METQIYVVEWLDDVNTDCYSTWRFKWARYSQIDAIISIVNNLRRLSYTGEIITSGWSTSEMFVRSEDWQYQYRITCSTIPTQEVLQ